MPWQTNLVSDRAFTTKMSITLTQIRTSKSLIRTISVIFRNQESCTVLVSKTGALAILNATSPVQSKTFLTDQIKSYSRVNWSRHQLHYNICRSTSDSYLVCQNRNKHSFFELCSWIHLIHIINWSKRLFAVYLWIVTSVLLLLVSSSPYGVLPLGFLSLEVVFWGNVYDCRSEGLSVLGGSSVL